MGRIDNLEGNETLFEDLKAGKQFGKLVIQIPEQNERNGLQGML